MTAKILSGGFIDNNIVELCITPQDKATYIWNVTDPRNYVNIEGHAQYLRNL